MHVSENGLLGIEKGTKLYHMYLSFILLIETAYLIIGNLARRKSYPLF